LPVQHLEQLVGLLCLVPVHVSGMPHGFVEAGGRVTVENRAAKGDVFGAVAIATDGEVPTGHNELKLVGSRSSKNGDRLRLAVPVRIVFELLENALVPVLVVEPEEDLANQIALVGREKLTTDVELGRFGDVPVVGNVRAKQAPIVDVIPFE